MSIFNLSAASLVQSVPLLVYLPAWKSQRVTVIRNLLSSQLQFNSFRGRISPAHGLAGNGHLQLLDVKHRNTDLRLQYSFTPALLWPFINSHGP